MNTWLDKTSYEEATFNVLEVAATPSIIGFECDISTLTLGKRSVDIQSEASSSKHFHAVSVGRGGHATLHNPGQLVVYPKVDLNVLGLGVREFVCRLEQTCIELMLRYGVQLRRSDGEPGLYSDQGKMVFLGLRIKRGVVHHGVSINVSNDLSEFAQIRSCGQWRAPVSSLKSHGVEVSLQELFEQFCEVFQSHVFLTPPQCPTNLSQQYSRV